MGSPHTNKDASARLRLVPGFGLVDIADPTLGERLAEIGAGHLVSFASRMHERLLAASVAIGLGSLGSNWSTPWGGWERQPFTAASGQHVSVWSNAPRRAEPSRLAHPTLFKPEVGPTAQCRRCALPLRCKRAHIPRSRSDGGPSGEQRLDARVR